MKSLQQLVRRYAEEKKMCQLNKNENTICLGPVKMQHKLNNRPMTQNVCEPQFTVWKTEKFVIKLNKANNCVKMKSGGLVLIDNIATSQLDQSILIIGRKFEKVVEYFNVPCSSELLNIHLVSQLSYLQSWKLTDISEKMMRFPILDDETKFVVMPLLHLQ